MSWAGGSRPWTNGAVAITDSKRSATVSPRTVLLRAQYAAIFAKSPSKKIRLDIEGQAERSPDVELFRSKRSDQLTVPFLLLNVWSGMCGNQYLHEPTTARLKDQSDGWADHVCRRWISGSKMMPDTVSLAVRQGGNGRYCLCIRTESALCSSKCGVPFWPCGYAQVFVGACGLI